MPLLSQLIEDESGIDFSKKIDLISPLSGEVMPLDKMPDPLFVERLFGEGFAIAPSGYQVVSPFLAKIEHCSPTMDVIRLRSKSGLLMQIQLGFDGFTMHGEGFRRLVNEGQVVKSGTPLLTFDLIKMKQKLESVMSAVTLLNSQKLKGIRLQQKKVIGGEDIAMSLYI